MVIDEDLLQKKLKNANENIADLKGALRRLLKAKDSLKADVSAVESEYGEKSEYKMLLFLLGEQFYAVDINCIREVSQAAKLFVGSGSAKKMRTAINSYGVVVPIVDMLAHFGVGSASIETQDLILIVRARVANEVNFGFKIDGISRIMSMSVRDIVPVDPGREGCSSFVVGKYELDGRLVWVLKFDLSLQDVCGGEARNNYDIQVL